MKFRTALITIAACGLSFPSLANVTLELPYQAELVLVNGVEKSGNTPLNLPNGINQIAFTYQDSLRENGDDHLFKSDVIIVKFAAKDTTVALDLPKFRSSQEAKKFNKSPKFTLVENDNNKLSFKQDKLIKTGLQLGRNYEEEIAAYNMTGKIAAVAPVVAVTLPEGISPNAKSGETQVRNVAENMLNYWYAQADEATRARFKAKITQQ
ncbi:YccT family protein [Photobacterium nomapromontoriensis]|uniref:YccT family protein n=1 Tax=Photobacterium nomapromontoriensis TaxID=2910237 RepID=UPI003D0FDD27